MNPSRQTGATRPLWLILAPAIFLLLWSGGYVVAKVAIAYAEPLTVLVVRYTMVVVAMAALFLILRPPLPKTRAEWVHLAIVGLLIQTIYFGMSYLAFDDGVASGTVALIMSLQPVLVAIVAPHWSGESVGWRRWSGLGLGLVGTAAVIVARSEVESPPVLGFLFAGIGLAGMTIGTLWEKRFGLSHHPVTANLIGFAAGLAGILPIALATESQSIEWSWPFVGALAYLVIGNSLIATSLLLAMIRAGEVSRVSALLFLVPPVAGLMAWGALGEVMPPLGWVGIVLAGIGVLIATRSR
ncbi:MAG: DMT family transporter [Paracoccaceae bacterium]